MAQLKDLKSNTATYLGSKHLLGILRTDENKIYDVIETPGNADLEIRELMNPKNIIKFPKKLSWALADILRIVDYR